jgi:hypothetical protein
MVSGRGDEGDADIWIYARASFHLSGTGALREAFSGTFKKNPIFKELRAQEGAERAQ